MEQRHEDEPEAKIRRETEIGRDVEEYNPRNKRECEKDKDLVETDDVEKKRIDYGHSFSSAYFSLDE